MNLIHEIVSWSKNLPLWQQDAVRRIFSAPKGLSDSDIGELAELCQKESGLLPTCSKTSMPLVQASVPSAVAGARVIITKLSGLKHVNCIDPHQELKFAEKGLTVIYGENGSGKSGYARVIKRACYSRDRGELILPDVKDSAAVGKTAEAVFDVDENGTAKTYKWKDGAFVASLSDIAVFDARSARVVLDEAQDCRYVPYGLDIVQDLGNKVVPGVRAAIEAQANAIDLSEDAFKGLRGEHEVGKLFADLPHADILEIRRLANFSSADMERGKELSSLIGQQVGAELIANIRQKVDRIKNLAKEIRKAYSTLADQEISKLEEIHSAAQAACAAANMAARIFSDETEFLKGTGSEPWRLLFESARHFADEVCGVSTAYPDGFSRCVLCQQQLDIEAVRRIKQFDAYVKEDASKNAEKTRSALADAQVRIARISDGVSVDDILLKELADIDSSVSESLSLYKAAFSQRKVCVLQALKGEVKWDFLPALDATVAQQLRDVAARELRRAHKIRLTIDERKRVALIKERDSLRARYLLHQQIKSVEDWFVRMRRKQDLSALARSLTTTQFTKKAKELFVESVTKPLLDALREEFDAIGVSKIRLKPSLVEKGE